jgi:hypothetical protein
VKNRHVFGGNHVKKVENLALAVKVLLVLSFVWLLDAVIEWICVEVEE